jgi:hypothetical protein
MSKEFMEKEPDHKALDAGDIALLKSYVRLDPIREDLSLAPGLRGYWDRC